MAAFASAFTAAVASALGLAQDQVTRPTLLLLLAPCAHYSSPYPLPLVVIHPHSSSLHPYLGQSPPDLILSSSPLSTLYIRSASWAARSPAPSSFMPRSRLLAPLPYQRW